MAKFVKAIQAKLGDPSTAALNTTRFDDSGFDIEALRAATNAMPFLAPRRLVILECPSRKVKSTAEREKFFALLDGLPATTAFLLIEKNTLEANHWLYKWATNEGGRAYVRGFTVPKGSQMVKWIENYVKEQGGQISPQAASFLAESVGDNPRMAALEVDKVLAYVNYARPVDVEDVDTVAAYVGGQGNFFTLIDAIARRDGTKAMAMLRKLLEEQDALLVFFSLVGHFRLLLQAREIFEGGGRDAAVEKALGIHPYRAKKLVDQAKTLSLQTLEDIYRRLQEYDLDIKTGQLGAELALESMIAALTA